MTYHSQDGWLKQQTLFISKPFWRPEVQDQGAGKLFLEAVSLPSLQMAADLCSVCTGRTQLPSICSCKDTDSIILGLHPSGLT
jgi:hypothetical protein